MKKPTKAQLALASKAANRLFTDGSNQKADRLLMEFPPNAARPGTGWCKNAVRDVIANVLAGN